MSIDKGKRRFDWCCDKEEIFSSWEIPCSGCDKKCNHLSKVSPDRHILKRTKREVKKRDGNACLKCGSSRLLTIDHIHPISKGGSNNKDNLQTLCHKCNVEKGVEIIDYTK